MDTQDYIHLLVDHVSKMNKDGKYVNTENESPESQQFLLEIKNDVLTEKEILKEANEVLQELFKVENAYYKLLEYNKNGMDKILYVNKFDTDQLSIWKWLGFLFGFTNEQFNKLLEGYKVEDIPMFTAAAGKHSSINIIKEVKNLKVLDEGRILINPNLIAKERIAGFRGSKYFKENEELRFRIQIMTKAQWIPFGPIFWPMFATMKKEMADQ